MLVGARSARWLVAVTSEIIDSFAADPGPDGVTGVVFGLSIDGEIVAIVATGSAGPGPSLHLDGARRLVVAMGGRFRETIEEGARAIDIAIPCRVSDRRAS